jgi:uncharacterized protein with PQ loop repeat
MKQVIGIIAVILTFVGYIPYIRDTLRGKTRPHVYTWFIWGLITLLAFGLQIKAGAGVGSLVTLAAGLVCAFIAVLGYFASKKDKSVDRIDTACFILALAALVIWLFADQPITAVIILSSADMLGFIPTIRKSWDKPYQETLFSYEMNTFRFALAIYALQSYNIVALLYPLTWILANGLFSIYLIARRRAISA